MKLINLFLTKSGICIYDKNGIEIEETLEEKISRKPWTDAYEIPVLLLGKSALKYASDLPQFSQAIKVKLIENNNEISFIINKKINFLKELSEYKLLKKYRIY